MSTKCGVRSERVCRASGLPVIDRAIRLIKQAGAPSEESTARDGVLSHSAETHAAGAGLGLGFIIAASGTFRYLGILFQLVIVGNRGDTAFSPDILEDCRTELPYFLGGLVFGAVLGLGARLFSEVSTLV